MLYYSIEVMLNSETIKPLALGLFLSEGISQSCSQSVEKFHSNLLEAFCVALKALLGLVTPYQYCFFWLVFFVRKDEPP